MRLEWMGEYRDLVEKLIRYCNNYAQTYNVELNFDTPVDFSYSQLQVMEYILENEERRENMASVAARLGIPPSTFSKNVKKMMDKGLLEKFRIGSNRKDIIVRVSPLGRTVYEQYSHHVYRNGFKRAFDILDEIPREYIDKFTHMLDVSSKPPEASAVAEEQLIKIE